MRTWIRAFEKAVSGTYLQGTMVTHGQACCATNACMISCAINVRAAPARPRVFCKSCSRQSTVRSKYTDGQWLQSPRFDKARIGAWLRECGLHTRGSCRCCAILLRFHPPTRLLRQTAVDHQWRTYELAMGFATGPRVQVISTGSVYPTRACLTSANYEH